MKQALAAPADVRKRDAAARALEELVMTVREFAAHNSHNDSRARNVLSKKQFNITHEQTDSQNYLMSMAGRVRELAGLARELSSRHLNDVLQSAANEAQQGTAQDFLRTLRLCGTCADFIRVGEPNDGGYIMCADGLSDGGLLGAYSYGINGYDGWGMGVASMFHVPLYEFDCFDTRQPGACPGCQVRFSPQCVEGNFEGKPGAYGTMTQHMQANGHAAVANGTLLLKLDVEGAEWAVFSQEHAATLSKFRQINTELHGIGAKAYDPVSLQAMQKILASGFSVVHLHGNNNAGTAKFGQYSVPDVLEVTLVRSATGAACANRPPQHIPEDRPCNPEWGDAIDPVLPQ